MMSSDVLKNVQISIGWVASAALLVIGTVAGNAQEWSAPVRGSWVRYGTLRQGDVVLADEKRAAEIVLSQDAPGPIRQAAAFLAGDIEKLSGKRPAITTHATAGTPAIHLVVAGVKADSTLPPEVDQSRLVGKWEAYQVLTAKDGGSVWLVGADARGTAFAAYTLSERLGIDPLYLWTGYEPKRQPRLALARVNYFSDSPTVKYRGLFHDDEDILPRPFDYRGYPLYIGNVPLEWYKRFFETALRLRMNMVAPYTRTHRRFEVQQLASDWGLFYTSHHYDILLSNPFGFHHFNLAEKRGVTGAWDWLANRSNMLKYWRGGVEENGSLDCLWPVGLRGTDDYAYPFPKGMSATEQNRIFREVIEAQIETTRDLAPRSKGPPVFTFTLYGEMLDKYLGQGGKFEMPDDVILIWPDDNDGRMRALPRGRNQWRHGVYYHLAYYGPVTKQSMHVVPPARIANEFQKIAESGATEFALVNVSELREFVREARMIAEICWDSRKALRDNPVRALSTVVLPHVPTEAKQPLPPDAPSPSAERYVRWFSREYFGAAAAEEAAKAYRLYDQLLDRSDRQWYANDRVVGALNSLVKKLAGQSFAPVRPETVPTLKDLGARCAEALGAVERAESHMERAQRQFFFENCELPLRVLQRQSESALMLVQAMNERDSRAAWELCERAMGPLEKLETELARAERPPFERWYAETFIRNANTGLNLHRPYQALRAFLSSGGKRVLAPHAGETQNVQPFLPVVESYQDAVR